MHLCLKILLYEKFETNTNSLLTDANSECENLNVFYYKQNDKFEFLQLQ